MSLQASFKVTKKNNHESNNNKKHLNNLINVLRPKVYITDSSNFKRLVQELTGNGSSSSTMPFSPSPRRTEAALENNVPVIDIVDDYGDKLKASVEACSFDASVDSFDFCHNLVSFTEGFREVDDQMYLDDATFDVSVMNDQLGTDWLAYQDLESWLLDIDQPCPSSFNGFGQNQEVSICDYKLSGLI